MLDRSSLPAALSLLVFGLGCAGAEGSRLGEDPQPETVLAAIEYGGYLRSSAILPAASGAWPSALNDGSIVMSYVTTPSFPWYEKIAPERTGSGVSLAVGATIVRSVLDASGAVTKLTVMVRGADGSNPTVGDYWFAVTDPGGNPLVVDGKPQVGQLTQCYSCHQERAADGYLFGVPVANRAM